ncbi:T9SS type A sorting domain-containing protein [Aquimarina sp. RZ0]|uniref:T9SS type A sorting domain-containing protein n=1 Tax=Aquimarina sp. RZ0 TaxID=2607730 RepID=UPI0011F1816C|nr:T9SS type A sorting domain-containing protein [Aquimarina sp. RZ0]KAA1247952.1 T9SS type A sorting domain-containing protein [Aquimarina sp. RZ0]
MKIIFYTFHKTFLFLSSFLFLYSPAQGQNAGICSDPFIIQCGMSLTGDLEDGENNIESYGEFFTGLTGVEQIYELILTEPSTVEVTLTNLTDDLELVIFSDCSNPKAVTGSFEIGSTVDERAVANLDAKNTYYIAVEGHKTAISDYTLTINCTPLCSNNSGLVETFENGEPSDWTFTVSGSGDPDIRKWRFDNSAFGVGVTNAGSSNWASFDDFVIGESFQNNVATATTPTVDLSDQQNIKLFFDYGFDETIFVTGDQTRLSITDGTKTYYWRGDLLTWTTTLSPWLDDDDTQFAITSDAIFNELIPTDLDTSNLSVTIEYDDGGSASQPGWGFGFDNFVLCGDTAPVLSNSSVANIMDNTILISNPMSDILSIHKLPKGHYTTSLYSMEGVEVLHKDIKMGDREYQLELPSFLSTGVYILRISNNNSVINKKILVNS